jgi:hypothetical protein
MIYLFKQEPSMLLLLSSVWGGISFAFFSYKYFRAKANIDKTTAEAN